MYRKLFKSSEKAGFKLVFASRMLFSLTFFRFAVINGRVDFSRSNYPEQYPERYKPKKRFLSVNKESFEKRTHQPILIIMISNGLIE